MKSEVSGVAGAVRVDQLKLADLTAAEHHGKRLDLTGKSRAINDEPPITTTGLDLHELFQAHIKGAYVPRARFKAMHVIIQFPKDLVDGNDAASMLHHAREFTRRVFGGDAIFADRVDRDEKSRHLVDLFVAPKYLKKTKHQEKVAVTMSRHLKAVAEKYGHGTTPREIGRALQDALFQYLREDMGLAEAQRGSPKLIPGDDWKAAEQLRVEELDEQKVSANSRERDLDEQERRLAAARDDFARRETALAERERQSAEYGRNAAALLAEAELRRLELEAMRAAAAAELAAAEQIRRESAAAAKVAKDEADRLLVEQRQAVASADAAREAAVQYAVRAKREHEQAEDERARAADATLALVEERRLIDEEHQLHDRQLALLERAIDEDSGLRLRVGRHRVDDRGFVMDEDPMLPPEWASYIAPWHPMIAAIARRLARALDTVRQLLGREIAIAAREAALTAKEAEADQELAIRLQTQRAEHQTAMLALDAQRATLDVTQAEAARILENAVVREVAAAAREQEADSMLMSHERWAIALKIIGETPDMFIIDNQGAASLDMAVARSLGPDIAATFQTPRPDWAERALAAQIEIAAKTSTADERERLADFARERLDELIGRGGEVMTPEQKAFVDEASSFSRSVTRWRDPGEDQGL